MTEIVKTKGDGINHREGEAGGRPDRTCDGENAGEVRRGKNKETPKFRQMLVPFPKRRRTGSGPREGWLVRAGVSLTSLDYSGNPLNSPTCSLSIPFEFLDKL